MTGGEKRENQPADLCLSQPLNFPMEIVNNKLECEVHKRYKCGNPQCLLLSATSRTSQI